MFKKLLLAAGLVGAGTFLMFGTKMGAYGRASLNWAKNVVASKVPVEADIMAAKTMLSDMEGKIDSAVRVVATERVAVRGLEKQHAARQEELAKKRDQLISMRKSIETNAVEGHADAQTMMKQARLVTLWESYEMLDAQHKAEGRLLESRQKGLLAAELKVTNLKNAREQLQSQIATLEARIKLRQAEKVAAKVEIDDSEIASLKNLVNDIEKKLDVEIEVDRELENFRTNTTPETATTAKDVIEKMDAKFGKPNSKTGGTSL